MPIISDFQVGFKLIETLDPSLLIIVVGSTKKKGIKVPKEESTKNTA